MGSMINAPGREPIAIIGLSCKFAGSASTPENLWEMLAEGRNAWSEIPTSRFNAKGTHHPNHEKLNTTNAKGAHFIEEDVGLFDAAFFNFSAETASALDPQFRLQLESAYEALENAGLPLSRIRNSNTSVYAGVFAHDYHEGLIRDEDQLPRFLPIGTFSAMSSNRISHFFDLRGASMTIDTGCSTTLVALHQAVNSLRNRESDMSIVSGANLLLTPDMFKVFGSLGMLSPDGKSYAFDSRANGYGRGEGVATIVIKRLDDALACGDPVRAVIRETFLNQDGKTETITTPSQAAQEELMHECYRRAGLDPRDTQYFEAHGTGTPTGDPIEARAIAAVFGGSHRQEPLRIGSLKTNIGHTEAVSGLAGLIKVVLALEKNQIPPSINFEKPNPKLALENWGLEVATSLEPWPSSNPHQPRRASLNNFGFGGSNSHVILEGAESFVSRPVRSERGVKTDDSGTVLVFSGRDEKACQRMVSNVKEYLQSHKTTQVSELVRNLSYTLGNRRTLFPWVAAGLVRVQNDSMGAIIQALESPSFAPVRTLSRRPRIGMIFTGQGAQWHAMGRELMDLYPVFTSSLKESERHLKTLGAKWSLLEEMQRSEQTSRVNSTELSIPICVALQIALVRLLESWGIMPTAVVSHSSGEIAAAYAAGALTLGQAMAAAHYRAALAADPNMRLVGEKGGMLAIGLGATEAQEYVDNLATSGKAVVACINSPESVTIAGDVSAVEELEEVCKQLSIFSRRLRVDTGYHSHHMQPIAGPYLELLRQHMPDVVDDDEEPDPDTPTVAFSSAVTGGRIDSLRQIASPEHWVDSLLQPVQFVEAVIDMILGDHGESGGSNVDVLLEVGPHTALAAPVREILSMANFEGLDIPYYGCLTRKEPAGDTMRATAVNLLLEGLPLDMHRINFPVGASQLRVLTDLPSYPWNHNNRHWQESRLNRSIRAREQQPHTLLGSLVPSINTETSTHWRNILRVGDSPWLRDHVVQDNIVYPGAGYVCLAIEAAKQLAAIESTSTTKEITGYRLRDVELLAALVVPDDSNGIEVQTKLYQADARIIGARGWRQFEITSATLESRWTLHAKGLVMVEFDDTPESESKLELRPLSGYTRHVDPEDMFSSLRSRGIYHGPLFQNTLRIEQDGREDRSVSHVAIADTSVPDDLPSNTVLHPTTLDSVILSSYSALPGVGSEENDAKLPYSISSLWVSNNISHEAGHAFQCHTSLSHKTARNFRADAIVYDEHVSGARRRLLEMQGLVCQSMGRSRANLTDKSHNKWEEELCTKIEWAPDLSLRQPKAVEKFKQQHARPATDIDKEVVIRLRRVSVYFCHDVLKGLTNEDIAQLEPHHKKFLRWMQDQIDLAASGQQGPGSEKWTSDGTTTREREIALAAKQSVEGEMVCHLGPKTLAILRQERPALEVMMEDRLLYRYYAEAFRMGPSLVQLAALLRQVVHKNPRARILEIGGGTGGATRHMLKAIGTAADGGPRAASWHFTDISSGFFEAARTEFAEWSEILKFDKLDIEKDPATQGFDLASYDIVVACEVLHATKSMARTMANVRSLMKPGGTLLMMETTQDQVDIQYTFGLLPGWWLSEEPQRQSSPSLTIPFFDPVLKEAGFSGVDLDIRDCESDDMYSISVIMTRAEAEQNQASSRYSEDTTIVISRKVPPPSWMIDSLKGAIRASTGGAAPAVFSLEDVTDGNAYTGKICVFLGDIMQPILPSIDQGTFEAIKAMTNNCKGLLWVSVSGAVECASPDSSLSHGLLRTLRNEFLGRRYISLDLEGPIATSSLSSSAVSTITNVIELGFNHAQAENSSPFDFEYAERDGILLVPRLFKDQERNQLVAPQPALEWDQPETILSEERFLQQDRPLRLEVGIDGLLDTLAFGDYDVESKSPLAPDMVEIEPRAYGLNFRDVMVAMGQLKERVMGLECSGVITCLGTEAQGKGFKVGDPVIALLLGPFASRAQIPWHGVVHMPQNMSFEDAASVPMVFGTAYVGLVDTARFRPGQSILIHSAAGGVGQAAIMLAKHLGAGEIFVTVSSQEKRELMSRQYGIPDDHIFSSRNLSFAPAILAATNGRGVDVVLNSLAGPLLQASFDVLATFGHLVEIGKKDLEGDSLLGMGTFSRVASYSSLDMMTLLRCRGNDIHRVLSDISRLMQEEVLKPVYPCTVYSIGDVTKAFRLLQTGKHMGKIVLSIKPNDMVMVRPRVAIAARLRPDASYLLVGGIGGLGRSIAHWLVSHGAKNLIVMSRSAGNVRKSGAFVAELRGAGCRVQAISCDVTKAGDLAKAVRTCEKEGLPPVRGVVQGAMVLQDSVFEHMTLDDWQTCIGPKVDSTRNLHVQWSQPGSLDFFVMLSSFSGILGIVSQANYAAGSAYQDAMARWRSARGLPGVSIDLGAVKGVGYVAETAGVADRMRAAGETLMLEEKAVHRALQAAIAHPTEQPQILLGLNTGPGPQWDEQGKSQMSRDARFLPLRYRAHQSEESGMKQDLPAGGSDGHTLAGKLAGAESAETAAGLVGEAIAAKLAVIFMLPAQEIDLTQPPAQYGIDSLVAVELRNMLMLQAGAEVSIFNIIQSVSLAALALQVVAKSRFIPSQDAPAFGIEAR